MHGETLAQHLCNGPVAYRPGVWFNSAKFFDIEYQTYGQLASQWAPDSLRSFYWAHDGGRVAFRMQLDLEGKILGAHNFGFRLRHAFFDRAIRERWSGEQVIARLAEANFDPEFFAPYYMAIQQAFQTQFGGNFPLPKRSFIQKLFGAGV
jgi:hypothetical protein